MSEMTSDDRLALDRAAAALRERGADSLAVRLEYDTFRGDAAFSMAQELMAHVRYRGAHTAIRDAWRVLMRAAFPGEFSVSRSRRIA